MKIDALGNEVVIGNKYGYSTDSSGITTSVIGEAKKETKSGVSLTVLEARKAYSDGTPKVVEYDRKTVNVKAMKLFPVN